MDEDINIGELWIELVETSGLNQMQKDLHLQTEEVKKMSATASRILSSMKGLIATYATFEILKATLGQAVTKYATREQELLRLEAVLKAHNVKGKEINRIYLDLAESISNSTIYTSTQALAAEEILTSMGVAPDMMRDALEASTQLASRTGSLETSAQMIGQALEGNMKAIGRLVLSLRGAKDIDARTLFNQINATYGDVAKKEIEGYIGQVKKLRKEYDSLLRRGGGMIVPILTKMLKAVNDNPQVIAQLHNPSSMLYSILIKAFSEKEWTWSVGNRKDQNILEQADKDFRTTHIEKQKKSTVDLLNEWIKAEAERYAAAEELNEKWFETQRKEAEKIAKAEREMQLKNAEYLMASQKENMVNSWNIKEARIKFINDMATRVTQDQMSRIGAMIQSVIALNPTSQGAGLAALGLRKIINVSQDQDFWSKKYLIDKEYYDRLREIYKDSQSVVNQDIRMNTGLMSDEQLQMKKKYEMLDGLFQILSGISEMIYEASDDETGFRVYQALAIVQTTITTIIAAKKAYDIGEDIPYVGEYLKWIFMAIAIVAGLARVAQITSTQPGRSHVPQTIDEYSFVSEKDSLWLEKKTSAPVINWFVFDEMNTNRDFAREILPYVTEAREDLVH